MTERRQAALERLKNYVKTQEQRQYSAFWRRAQQDRNVISMVQDITLGQVSGKSPLAKNRYKF